MAPALRSKDVAHAGPDGLTWPSREQVEDGLRQARRMVTSARHSAEDAAEDAFVAIRRHPFTAVALAATAGVALGAAAVGVASVIHRLKAGGSCD